MVLREKFGLKGLNLKLGRKEAGVEAKDCEITLYESIETARQAWQDAKIMFDHETEKDKIDALIHKIDAYEREYIHLLKLARREGISVFPDIK